MVVGWEGSTPSPKALIEAPRAPHSQNPASGDLQSPSRVTVIWLCSATAPERGMGAVIGATSSATAARLVTPYVTLQHAGQGNRVEMRLVKGPGNNLLLVNGPRGGHAGLLRIRDAVPHVLPFSNEDKRRRGCLIHSWLTPRCKRFGG